MKTTGRELALFALIDIDRKQIVVSSFIMVKD